MVNLFLSFESGEIHFFCFWVSKVAKFILFWAFQLDYVETVQSLHQNCDLLTLLYRWTRSIYPFCRNSSIIRRLIIRRFIFFSIQTRPPTRLISGSFEVAWQRENETKTGAHARIEPGEIFFFARPLDFTPQVRREWKEKRVSPYTTTCCLIVERDQYAHTKVCHQ